MAGGGTSSLCLTMIVKDEATVIGRCLDSVRRLVSAWSIVDTGSTDGTQDVIRAHLSGLPGELHERPWRDFGHNRSEAIALARGRAQYDLVIDADDVLVAAPGFAMPPLTADSYRLRLDDGGYSYWRTQIFRADLDFRYEGVLHEVLVSDEPRSLEPLEGVVYRRVHDGRRSSDPDKYRKDAAVLETALAREPDNARYAFYLAQSWRDAGELAKAADAYARRAAMDGFEEETFHALFEHAQMLSRLGRDVGTVLAAYQRAYERRPTRAEPLCEAARFLREKGRHADAYPFACAALKTPRPDEILFVDESVYRWRALDEYAVAAFWTGRYREAMAATQRLLSTGILPSSERERVTKNASACLERLGPGWRE